jgi:hypothetical protein
VVCVINSLNFGYKILVSMFIDGTAVQDKLSLPKQTSMSLHDFLYLKAQLKISYTYYLYK